MENEKVIEMLREMQVEAANCQGFFAGHVTQIWVIEKLLGDKIIELGGKPYTVEGSTLVDTNKK